VTEREPFATGSDIIMKFLEPERVMYSLNVRDHFMIAHSFKGEIFGPARRLHGATYVVDVTFRREELDADGLVVDIGLAGEVLSEILDAMNYRNLDDEPAFDGQNTTTEFLSRAIWERVAAAIREGRLGEGAKNLSSVRVRLNESHVAWGSYEGAM
jgi:6-pyruvoyltetrahydropterin/6-carboxytetrahydropterin synthase